MTETATHKGLLTRDEAQELADTAKDAASEHGASMQAVWAVEEAVLRQFGFTSEEDEDD